MIRQLEDDILQCQQCGKLFIWDLAEDTTGNKVGFIEHTCDCGGLTLSITYQAGGKVCLDRCQLEQIELGKLAEPVCEGIPG